MMKSSQAHFPTFNKICYLGMTACLDGVLESHSVTAMFFFQNCLRPGIPVRYFNLESFPILHFLMVKNASFSADVQIVLPNALLGMGDGDGCQ